MVRNPFRRIRLVYRRSSPLLKCVVIGCILLAIITLLTIGGFIQNAKDREEAARKQAAEKERENAQLEEDLQQQGTIEWIIKIAREKLGLLPEDSELIIPQR